MNICGNCGLDNRDTARFCNNCGSALGAIASAMPGPAVQSAAGAAAPFAATPTPVSPSGGGGTPPAAVPAAPAMAPAPSLAPVRGQTLPLSSVLHGQYLILKKLAEGGMGAVYLAQDQQLFDRLCVVKEMLPYYATTAEKADAELKFEREARLLATLRHPGIPQVYYYFIEQDRYYLVMEFVEGEDLEEKLTRMGGPLPENEVIDYIGQVASVLAYIGRQTPPVIHRDIKPANIIVDKNTSQVKLVDFGIAREVQSSGPSKSQALGTPGYSPPEQYSRNTEPRSDVFALGATMHHLLSARDPSQFPLFAYPPLGQVVQGITPALEELVRRMVEQDVNKRPTAQEVRDELKRMGQPPAPAASGPFAFRTGALAHDVMALSQECDRHWDDGVYHLYNGHFEPWLQGLNRFDLAARAETIRKKGGDPNAGLEEFLRALNPTMALPVLSVAPRQLSLGTVEKGDTLNLNVDVENCGRGYLHGDARALVPWVKVTPATFGCQAGERLSLTLELDSGQLDEGNVSETLLSFTSSGGQSAITAQFLVTWQPKLALDARRLDFGEILEDQLGQQLPAQFTLTNTGGGLLEGRLTCPDAWVTLGAGDFRLLSGQSMIVGLVADSGQLSLARSQMSAVSITSTGGDVALPVRVGVMKQVYRQRVARWGAYGLLLLLGMLGWSIAAALSMQALLGFRRDSLTGAAWLAGALVVSWLATRLARTQVPLLDEIEVYYHQGDLEDEIPAHESDRKRLAVAAGGGAVAGLALGLNYYRSFPVAWIIPGAGLAGALLCALLASGSGWRGASASRRFGGVRLLSVGMIMAFLGTLLAAHWASPSSLRLIIWWALVGLALTAESYSPLPLRLRWLLAQVRTGLLCTLLAYLGWLAGLIVVGQRSPSLVAMYTRLPSISFALLVGYLVPVVLTTGGMVLGLWVDGTRDLDRRQGSRAMLWALVPGLAVALTSFVIGRVVFTLFSGFMARGWGVLATVVAAEMAAAWVIQSRSPQAARVWGRVRGAGSQAARLLAAKVKVPAGLASGWGKVQGRLPALPAGTSYAGLTLAMAAGVAGTVALLAPLAASILGTFLSFLACVAPVAVVLALLAWYVRRK